MTVLHVSPFRRTVVAPLVLAAAALLGSSLLQGEAKAVTPPSSAAINARRAQPAPPGTPNTPPEKIPRGAGAGSDNSNQPPSSSGGGATLESNKSYIMEYGIVVVLVGAALGAICKSSHRV
jgi:hypothetical protein